MIDTYLKANIKDVGLIRWPTSPNPILVHIAPFHWYQKEKQDNEPQAFSQGLEIVVNPVEEEKGFNLREYIEKIKENK
jgi:hypothetical protein